MSLGLSAFSIGHTKRVSPMLAESMSGFGVRSKQSVANGAKRIGREAVSQL